MKIRLVIFCVFSIAFVEINAQPAIHFNTQKEKYWLYKEGLKNFMIFSQDESEFGCDIPARNRDANDVVRWSDEARMIGYYIATLSMEYDLQIKSGLSSNSPEVEQTKKELFFALEAINRLDWEAEQSWDCSACIGDGFCEDNINGFFIRDDVPRDFETNQTYIDKLNESWVPIHDGHRVKCIASSYIAYVKHGSEMSQDHLAFLFLGFACVKHFLPENENYMNKIFSDGKSSTRSFVKEVQEITVRIIDYLVLHDWTYWNICESRCVHGVNNEKDENVCFANENGSHTGSLCERGGANAFYHAVGFAASAKFITEGSIYEQHAINVLNSVYSYLHNNYWDIALAGDQSFPYVLAAIGGIGHINVYNHNAESKEDLMLRLVDVGIREHYEYLPLLFSLLHPEDDYTNPISQEYYECLLDAAPCTPYNGDVLSVEWSRGDRIGGDRVDVPNGDNAESNTSISPIYYMFYFNLSNEVFYYSAYDFSPIAINQMAIENIHLEFQTEYDKKNYMASNTIIANDYNVGNTLGRNSEDILPIPEIGRVQFVAGEKITLGENFKVIEGASFHASIDHRINARQCSETSFTDCHHILDDARYNENLILFRLKDSVLQAQLYSVKFNDENQFALSSEILLNAIPNPSNGKFTIESNLRDAEMLVMTMTGEVIYSGHYQDGKIEIDLTGLNMGVYILNLRNESATKSIKLVIN